MELEADETAGFILYKLGATLEESQRAMRSASVSIEGSYTHPPRAQRLEAIRKGWEKARGANPAPAPTPTPTPVANKMTDIDGNQYDVVKIGTMSWAHRNLDVTRFRNGDFIKNAASKEAWELAGKNGQPAWCYHNNDPNKSSVYGKLYNWYAVKDFRGLCPTGWHIPNDAEWTYLTDNLGGKSMAGSRLKSTTLWDSSYSGITNSSNFSAIPSGYRNSDSSYGGIRGDAFFWSTTEYANNGAWYRSLYEEYTDVQRDYSLKSFGGSIRCIMD